MPEALSRGSMLVLPRVLPLVLALLCCAAAAAEEYTLDGSHTYPMFAVSHSGLSMLHGRFDDTRGSFVLDREGGNSRVEAVIRVDSLDSGHQQRDKILLGEKFFDAQKHPEMRYVSSRVQFTGERSATVEGELSLHGVTRPVTLQVENLVCGVHPLLRVWACGFDATARILRSDFGMTSYLPKIVGDEVQIRIAAEAQRKDVKAGRP